MKKKLKHLVLSFAVVCASVLLPRMLHSQDAKRIEVTAKRSSYEPENITLKKGQPVVLVIKSVDVAHGLRFNEFNLNAKVPKGGSTELKFTPDKAGDFVGHCSVFCGSGHGGMTLTLHVAE